MKITPIYLTLSFVILFSYHPATAQADAYKTTQEKEIPSLFDEFYSQEVIDVTINSNFVELRENRFKRKNQDAHIEISNKEGKTWSGDIEIRTRGKFRCRFCDYPPLRIDLSKKDLREQEYDAYGSMKVVTHCKDDMVTNAYLVKEYMAYELYKLISPMSYRAQLVRIKYDCSEAGAPEEDKLGVFLENDKELAKRLGLVEFDTMGLHPTMLDPETYLTLQMFQFFLGNTDWVVPTGHNIKFFRDTSSGVIYPIAYDFDFSGLVNTYYAGPNTLTPITDNIQRFFMGQPQTDSELFEKVLNRFRDQRTAIAETIAKSEMLETRHKKELQRFIDKFYSIIDKPKKVEKYFVEQKQISGIPY